MPQASEEMRRLMKKRFGDIDSSGPEMFLVHAGYVLTENWEWEPKHGVKDFRDMTRDELDCLLFLAHEWDYGSLVGMP